jgi:3-deoxy-D-manno-octulosonate 8-phosphate phosphatase (KDO 8-P phosphatase)
MIKRLVTDVDGVLTDGGFWYNETGKVFKKFGPHDSDGFKLLREADIEVFAISADKRGFPITEKRLTDMKVSIQLVTESDRLKFIHEHFGFEGTAFVGDGIHDAVVLENCERGYAPGDATKFAKEAANVITETCGGRGVILEVALDIIGYNKQCIK